MKLVVIVIKKICLLYIDKIYKTVFYTNNLNNYFYWVRFDRFQCWPYLERNFWISNPFLGKCHLSLHSLVNLDQFHTERHQNKHRMHKNVPLNCEPSKIQFNFINYSIKVRLNWRVSSLLVNRHQHWHFL